MKVDGDGDYDDADDDVIMMMTMKSLTLACNRDTSLNFVPSKDEDSSR